MLVLFVHITRSAAIDPKVLKKMEAKISHQLPVSLPIELTGWEARQAPTTLQGIEARSSCP
jgi:hypothetical protein